MFRVPTAGRVTPGRHDIRFKITALLFIGLGLLAAALPAAGVLSPEQRESFQCIGCHTGNAKVFVNPQTGETKETLIHVGRKRSADHADVPCQGCHVQGFNTFPHFNKKILGCMDCHPREDASEEDAPYHFPRIDEEFKSTVHFTEHREKFSCAQCHHPHYFEATAHLGSPQSILETHNQWCLTCHSADPEGPMDTIERGLLDPADPSLVAEHPWIPHTALHLRKARCIGCHSGADYLVSHAMPLQENDGTRRCTFCHTLDSVQSRFYRYVKQVESRGFTNPAVLQDTYIMGATRYIPLDIFAYFVVGISLLGAVVHAVMRLIRRMKPKAADGKRDRQ